MSVSLAEYAKAHPVLTGPKCSVCSLPADLLKMIRKERAAGVAFTTIDSWLREVHGKKTSAYRIGHHFRVHEPAK